MTQDEEFDKIVDNLQAAIEREAGLLYSKKVIREAQDPQNVGRMAEPDCVGVITGPCGDTMEFYISVEDGVITDIKFWTDGCGPSIACGSMTTRLVKGKSLEKAAEISGQDIIDALDGLPEENLHCGKLAADTLQKALRVLNQEGSDDDE